MDGIAEGYQITMSGSPLSHKY